jgi:hypothetical protein
VPTTEKHFAEIQEFNKEHVIFWNEKNYDALAEAFIVDGVRVIGKKINVGREEIRAYLDRMMSASKLTAKPNDELLLPVNILGYRELGNDIVIAYGQWGNPFKIEGDQAKLLMEIAGAFEN